MACCRTTSVWFPLVIRIVLGVVFIAHGTDKLFRSFAPDNGQAVALTELGVLNAADVPAAAEDAEEPAAGAAPEVRKLHGLSITIHGWGWRYPVLQAWMAALTEFGGGILILIGLLGRLAALGLLSTMMVAIIKVHWTGPNVLDPAWMTMKGGWEYPGVLALLALAILLGGPGRSSLDALIFRRRPKPADTTESTETTEVADATEAAEDRPEVPT